MRIDIMTLFPDSLDAMLNVSILGRAQQRGYIAIQSHQIRQYTTNKQMQVDDYPYGGGRGAIMQADPLYRCWSHIVETYGPGRTIFLSPCGRTFTQAVARDPELAMSMLQYLARTVRLLSEQLDDMAFRPVPWRLARFLLSGADRLSTVHSTQDEMAASISASRVTVSRTLNDFARRGWVELGYREVRLLRPEELRALCQS